MKRYGAVLTFQPGVSKEYAQMCLDMIASNFTALDYQKDPKTIGARTIRVQEFDDAQGGPVWYIP